MSISVPQMKEYAAAFAESGNTDQRVHRSDVDAIRVRAREHVSNGAVTQRHGPDHGLVLELLNDALATELVCMLRYRRHFFMARGAMGLALRHELLAHSNEELSHADQIATRIVQLGGEPDLDPVRIRDRSHAEYVASNRLPGMIKEDLVAERIGIESYMAMIKVIGTSDSTTRRLLEDILAAKERHAEELGSILETLTEGID